MSMSLLFSNLTPWQIAAVVVGFLAALVALLASVLMAGSKRPDEKRKEIVQAVIITACMIILFSIWIFSAEENPDNLGVGFSDPEASMWELCVMLLSVFGIVAAVAAFGGLLYLLHWGLDRLWRRLDTPAPASAPAPASSSFVVITLDEGEWNAAPSHGNEELLDPPDWVTRKGGKDK